MSYEIIFIPSSEDSYHALVEQVQERWGYDVVAALENRIAECISLIQDNPYLFAITNTSTEARKCVLHKTCSMYYKIENNLVLIICFWDNRQDPIFI